MNIADKQNFTTERYPSPSPPVCLHLSPPLLLVTNVLCMVCGAVQLSDGFKSGLRQAMHNYTTNKKEAIDGIQTAVICFSL